MTAGLYAVFQRRLYYAQIFVQSLGPRKIHLFKNVIVRAGNQYARFLYLHLLDQLKVLGIGPYPGGYFRKGQIHFTAKLHRFFILVAVKEKFALAYQSARSAQAGKQLVKMSYLLGRKGRAGLLAVPEGGIGYPKLLGSEHGHFPMIEGNLGHAFIVEQLAVKVGLLYVLELIVVIVLL